MALRKLGFGNMSPSDYLKKFKGLKQVPSVISIIDKEGIAEVALHFNPAIGSFHCFDGICCQNEKPARLRYIIPIVSYRIEDMRVFGVSTESHNVQYLNVNEDVYNNFIQFNSVHDIDEMDFLVITENEKYGNYKFEPIVNEDTGLPRVASWKQDEAMRGSVISFYKTEYQEKIEKSLGKVLSPQDYLRMVQDDRGSQAIPPPPSSNNVVPAPTLVDEGEEEDIPFKDGASSSPKTTGDLSEINDDDISGLYE